MLSKFSSIFCELSGGSKSLHYRVKVVGGQSHYITE